MGRERERRESPSTRWFGDRKLPEIYLFSSSITCIPPAPMSASVTEQAEISTRFLSHLALVEMYPSSF